MLKKSDIKQEASEFDRYINLVQNINLTDAFKSSVELIENLDQHQLSRVGNKVYSPGKWTIKQIFQHLIDEERVMSYRALLFARDEKEKPNQVDIENINNQANLNNRVNDRTFKSLLSEYLSVRNSTIHMFNSFDDEILIKKGNNWIYLVSVLSIGFFLIGHQTHHFNLIKEKYFTL